MRWTCFPFGKHFTKFLFFGYFFFKVTLGFHVLWRYFSTHKNRVLLAECRSTRRGLPRFWWFPDGTEFFLFSSFLLLPDCTEFTQSFQLVFALHPFTYILARFFCLIFMILFPWELDFTGFSYLTGYFFRVLPNAVFTGDFHGGFLRKSTAPLVGQPWRALSLLREIRQAAVFSSHFFHPFSLFRFDRFSFFYSSLFFT